MAYRYKKRRYYSNSEDGIVIFIFFLIIGGIYKFKEWIYQLSETQVWTYGFIAFFIVASILGIWIYIKKMRSKNVEQYIGPVNSNNQNLINNDKQVSINNNYELMQRLRELQNKYFEDFVAKLFEFTGYVIDRPPQYIPIKGKRMPKKDGGIDLIISKEGEKSYIQIKKDFAHQTGVDIVGSFAGRVKEGNRKIVSTSIFSNDAKNFANKDGIELLDYEILLEIIQKLTEDKKQELEGFINDTSHIEYYFEYKPRTCPRCYAPLKNKNNRYVCINFYNNGCTYKE